jgi:hypothetical protein
MRNPKPLPSFARWHVGCTRACCCSRITGLAARTQRCCQYRGGVMHSYEAPPPLHAHTPPSHLHSAEAGAGVAKPEGGGNGGAAQGRHWRQAGVERANLHLSCVRKQVCSHVAEGCGVVTHRHACSQLCPGNPRGGVAPAPVAGLGFVTATAHAPQPPSPHPSFTPCMAPRAGVTVRGCGKPRL